MSCPACKDNSQQAGQPVGGLKPFQYEALPTERTFRLFKLHKGPPEEPIRGSLSNVSLDDEKLEYQALSYVWGSDRRHHEVECDGHQVLVTCNLFFALTRIRDEHKDTVWFIDSICIDQSSGSESLHDRSMQVRLMSEIYGLADCVIVDLGEEPEGWAAGEKMMYDFYTCVKSLDGQSPSIHEVNAWPLPPVSSTTWDTYVSIYQRPWFQRLWVIQEYSLARKVLFLLGKQLYPNDVLILTFLWSVMLLCNAFCNSENRYREKMTPRRLQMALTGALYYVMAFNLFGLQATGLRQGFPPPNIVYLFRHTYFFGASDKRDKVYALFGLVDKEEVSGFAVDYTESVRGLSRRFSLFLLGKDYFPELLHSFASYRMDDFPSWMINLEEDRRLNAVDSGLANFARMGKYSAGGKQPPSLQYISDGEMLTLKGWLLDDVVKTSQLFPKVNWDQDTDKDTYAALVEWDLAAAKMALKHLCGSFTDPGQLLRHFRLTTTGGGFRSEGAPLSEDAIDLFSVGGFIQPEDLEYLDHRDYWADHDDVLNSVYHFSEETRFGITTQERMCMLPESARVYDTLVIFRGFPVPLLLRKVEGCDGYRLVGAAYVHGVMNGEALELQSREAEDIMLH